MRYLGAITNDYDLVTKKYVDDATEVIQTLTSGTKIGSVGGTDLYAPSGGGGAETDPIFSASAAAGIALSDITNWNNKAEITETNNSIEFGAWKLVWGTVNMNSNSASGSGTFTAPYYNDTTITLGDDAFSGNPYVWCTLNGSATGTRTFSAHDVSASSFKIRMYSSHKNSTNFTCRWFAIGRA